MNWNITKDTMPPLWPQNLSEKIWRQQYMTVSPVKQSRIPYLNCLEHFLSHESLHQQLRVCIHFVPDSFSLSTQDFQHYVNFLSPLLSQGCQKLLLAFLDDCNDVLVPKWLQITVQRKNNLGHIEESLLVEDRQPRWNHPSLLTRIPLNTHPDW